MINEELMKDRVRVYGNNFPDLAHEMSRYFNIEVSPQDAAYTLSLLKQIRVDHTKKALSNATQGTDEHMVLLKHYEDSVADRDNYRWIAVHYDKYLQLT